MKTMYTCKSELREAGKAIRSVGIWTFSLVVSMLLAEDAAKVPSPAPTKDRVGFPAGYATKFQVLRSFNRVPKMQVVTTFGNELAASIARTNDLPYPYGSVLVLETVEALKDADGKPLMDDQGRYRRGKVVGLHVMRREKGFGADYGSNRTGEWEYVEYRPDGSYLTPPRQSFACSECHVKAGQERDFVYRGRFPALETVK